jgi:hypothetical protein
VTEAVQAQVDAGVIPSAAAPSVIDAQVAAAKPAAEKAALDAVASKAHASVDGTTVSVDWSNTAQRTHWVEQLAPGIEKKIRNSTKSATGSGASGSDTSFVNGADKRLTTPFLTGFNDAVVTVYWIALAVILLAFVITWFFKVPPLRQVSALQERADAHGVSATGTIQTQEA